MEPLTSIFTAAKPAKENKKPAALWSVDSPRRSGSFQGKLPFDDICALENGLAREYLTEECLSPSSSSQTWTHCKVHKLDKNKFKLYMEPSNKFLLSAKREGNTFYISQYESFPEETDGVPNERYCCVLRYDTATKQYKLFLCGCEDESIHYSLEKHACRGQDEEQIDGQLLAEITHGVKHIAEADAEMRAIKVAIPAIMEDKRTRAIWCPRADLQRDSYDKSHSGIKSANDYSHGLGLSGGSSSSTDSGGDQQPTTSTLELETKLPEWNEKIQSLVLKFNGGRVLAASAKNFLMCQKGKMTHPILQFGKCKKGRFVLDYRSPVAAVQAFGIALSVCNWKNTFDKPQ